MAFPNELQPRAVASERMFYGKELPSSFLLIGEKSDSFCRLLRYFMRQELFSITWPQNSNSFALNQSQRYGAEFVRVDALPVIIAFDPTVTFGHAHLLRTMRYRFDQVSGESHDSLNINFARVVRARRCHDIAAPQIVKC